MICLINTEVRWFGGAVGDAFGVCREFCRKTNFQRMEKMALLNMLKNGKALISDDT